MGQFKTKCDFCSYHTASGCMAKPNSYYCREATQEFYAWLATQKKNGGKK